jgi:hypothetical protein
MKPRKLSIAFSVFFVVCAVSLTAFTQQLPRLPDLQIPPGPPKREQTQLRVPRLREIANGSNRAVAQTSANGGSRQGFMDGTAELKRRQEERGEVVRPESITNTIPYWSDSFSYQGLEFNYQMVGTDPKKGSKTTVIPTVIIPLRFVFPDGQVFDASTDLVDGQTPVQGIVNSPIFQNYDFVSGGTHVGNTQYGDAFQRANFWDSVSTRSPNYHVLLGQPTVLPTQTINVPAGLGSYFTDPVSGQTVPLVDVDFLSSQDVSILTAANVSPASLPIIVWGSVLTDAAGGYHFRVTIKDHLQTYIGTTYLPQYFYGGAGAGDVWVLSHEVAEWMDDPFVINFTPGWDFPFLDPVQRCDSLFLAGDLLEVADPVEIFVEASVPLPTGSFTYHVTEAMFIDFFTRASRSRSVNGQYSFFEIGTPYGLMTGPSSPCTGHIEFKPTFIEFPGASFTAVTGINNRGDVTGFYNDAAGQHGFVLTSGRFSTLDFPGGVVTDPYKINDSGMVVGAFTDAFGLTHGFSYSHGTWTQIDFPGSSDTEAFAVNSTGDIVGVYDASQPITHGFLLTGAKFQTIETPYGIQSAAQGINDFGVITGFGWSDPFTGPYTGFKLRNNSFTRFDFPGSQFTLPYSINNASDLAGFFIDPEGSFWGMVTIYGYPYQVFAAVFGNNDLGQICGYAYDSDTARYRGFIGTLPLQRNSH